MDDNAPTTETTSAPAHASAALTGALMVVAGAASALLAMALAGVVLSAGAAGVTGTMFMFVMAGLLLMIAGVTLVASGMRQIMSARDAGAPLESPTAD